jgi:hypothetical protein
VNQLWRLWCKSASSNQARGQLASTLSRRT